MLYRATSDLMVAASPGFLARGAVNVISLDRLRDAAGEQWMRIRDGVHARLESLLRGILGPADFYARINDIAYLVTMPTSTPEEVNLICLRAAFELHSSLLGECHIDQLAVGTACLGGQPGELAVVPIPEERITVLAHRAGIHPLPPLQPSSAPRPSAPGPHAHQPHLPPPEAEHRLNVTHQFLPVWSVPNAAVTTYLCEAQVVTAPHRREPIPLHALEQVECQEVEMSCFHHGIAALKKATSESKPFILAVGLSYDTLGAPVGREAVLRTLRDLPQGLRAYLAFVIHHVPPGVAQTKLGTLVNLLRAFGRGVSATVAPHSRLLRAYQDIGLNNIGFALSEFGSNLPSQHEIEELALFARRNHLGTFVSHIANINVLKFVQDAGIQQLSGPAVAAAGAEPRGVWRLTWQKLMADPVVEIWG